MDSQFTPTRYAKFILLASLAWWLLALGLGILQARQEQVRWATPYGLTYLRTMLVPVFTIAIYYILALRRPAHGSRPGSQPRLWSQIFLLAMILVLTYWAAIAPLRHNWILLLGVWWLLPSLYLARTGVITTTTLLSLGSIVFTLILVEFLLQPFPQIWPGYARMVGSNWRRIHADIPTLEYEHDGVRYAINQLGFRGSQQVPEQVQIVALGDSNTFGVGTQQPWPEQLATLTGSFVLNLGMGGTDPPKHVYPLIAYGLPRQPDLVLEAYFEGNDLFTCYQPAEPSGPRWGDNLVLPDLIGGIKEMIRFLGRDSTITSELSYDIATPFIRSIAGRVAELTFSPAYAATLLLDRETIQGSENWRIASGSLRRMAELSREAGSSFILIYLPERTHVYWPLIREDEALLTQLDQDMVYAWEERLGCLALVHGRTPAGLDAFRANMDASYQAQRDLVGSLAENLGIPFLDLTPALQHAASQGLSLADPLETHYNDFVNQIIAEEVAKFLRTVAP